MDERSTGIVLRTRPLTESSLIVHWLTPDLGRVGTIARGARRPKSPFRGKVDLFYTAEFTFARSRRSELHILREVALRTTRTALRHDLGYLNQAAYGARLIEQTTETETPLPEIYALFEGFLNALPGAPPRAVMVLGFEAKLLAELGLSPREGKLLSLIESLASREWDEVQQSELTETELRELRQFLHGFLIYHLGKIPANRANAVRSNAT
ncbi:MAG: DNA repair protein RecO [Verrucomicrobia subdivision 3 bacterium]|nr:DNA repair protein RecO [Limisphaerales bacterium]